MGLNLNLIMKALRDKDIVFNNKSDTLEDIARTNNITPMEIYKIIRVHKLPDPDTDNRPLTAQNIEAKYSGTGLGRKTLAEICREVGVDLQEALNKLENAGIKATGDV
jgi:hypothetical protein